MAERRSAPQSSASGFGLARPHPPELGPAFSNCGSTALGGADGCPGERSALGQSSGGLRPEGTLERVGGRYQVEKLLARGGMARVVRARDRVTGERVAIKILHEEWVDDPIALGRLRLEATIGCQLSGPSFVRIIELLQPDSAPPALVMELLAGRDLRAVLKEEGALSPARVARLVYQTALALDQAHALRIVHRDLKPENLFLVGEAEQERVVLLDFGSARDNSGRTGKLTLMGTTIGSPFYMAPEQARGLEQLDHRADVWSLGAIAYECLTGSVPFSGSNGPSILLAILTQELKLPSRVKPPNRAALSPRLDSPILAALTKRSADRTASASEFGSALAVAAGLAGVGERWALQPLSVLEAHAQRPNTWRMLRLEATWARLLLGFVVLVLVGVLLSLAAGSELRGSLG